MKSLSLTPLPRSARPEAHAGHLNGFGGLEVTVFAQEKVFAGREMGFSGFSLTFGGFPFTFSLNDLVLSEASFTFSLDKDVLERSSFTFSLNHLVLSEASFTFSFNKDVLGRSSFTFSFNHLVLSDVSFTFGGDDLVFGRTEDVLSELENPASPGQASLARAGTGLGEKPFPSFQASEPTTEPSTPTPKQEQWHRNRLHGMAGMPKASRCLGMALA